MQINNNPAYQFLNSLTSSTNAETLKTSNVNETNSNQKHASNNYNVRNMTPTEFQSMINDLRESGQISEKDAMSLTINRHGLEMFERKDTKMDLINFYENQIEVTKSTPGTKGVEQLERSLQILKGIEAKNNSNIPNSI